MGLVLAAMIGSIDVVPALSEDDHKDMGKHDNGRQEQKKDMNMTAITMRHAGVMIGIMMTGNEVMSRRGSSMHRLHHRASVSFFHP